MRDRIGRWWSKFWKNWGKEICVVLAIVIPMRSSIADWNDVPTGSMEPTILVGDRVFVNKLAYGLRIPLTKIYLVRWGEPERGDIVVCFSPADGKRLVKRVIGLPGDLVAMRGNRLYINGEPVEYGPPAGGVEDAISAEGRPNHVFAEEKLGKSEHPVMFTPRANAPRTFGAVQVPRGRFLVMGDNRDLSLDSRIFGSVARKQIVGRVPAVVFSFDPEGSVRFRPDRWFRMLP